MIHNIYSIYDEKAKAYLPLFMLPEEGMAVRTFMQCCNDESHEFGRAPGDYTLFHLGTFDDKKCEIKYETPLKVHNGLELVSKKSDLGPKQLMMELLKDPDIKEKMGAAENIGKST